VPVTKELQPLVEGGYNDASELLAMHLWLNSPDFRKTQIWRIQLRQDFSLFSNHIRPPLLKERTMTRTLTLMIAATAAICFGSTAFAAEEPDSDRSPKQRHEALFNDLDSNRDGSISADEVPDEHRRLFERLKRRGDKNSDDKLNKEEFIAGFEEVRPDGPQRGIGDRPEGRRRGDGDRPDGPPGERRRNREGRGPEAEGDRPDRPGRGPDGQRGEGDRPDRRRPDGDRPDARRPDGDRPEGPGPDGQRRRRPEGRPDGGPEGMRGVMMGPALMRALDANGDGKISSSEISDAAVALKKLDKNGDGEIGRDELGPPQTAGGFRRRPGGESDRPGNEPGQREGREGRGPDMEVLMNRLKQFDKDGDGKFKKDELPERMQERFDDIDTNGNGVVDEAELRQSAGRFRRQEGQRPEGDERGERRRQERTEGRGAEERERNRD
jgi:Ca2+-binding EF-hand superfamily protein